jgi:hypothetical protein
MPSTRRGFPLVRRQSDIGLARRRFARYAGAVFEAAAFAYTFPGLRYTEVIRLDVHRLLGQPPAERAGGSKLPEIPFLRPSLCHARLFVDAPTCCWRPFVESFRLSS